MYLLSALPIFSDICKTLIEIGYNKTEQDCGIFSIGKL